MKKYVLILLLLVICGCNTKVEEKVENTISDVVETNEEIVEEEEKEEEYVNLNPIKLSLYVNNSKVSTYNSSMPKFTDIVSLVCYYTEDDNIVYGGFKDAFNYYYNSYSDIDGYKIGYKIKFSTTDGDFDNYIFRPSDVNGFFNYIQVYLYDDLHQDGGWYSHVEDSEYNDNTLLTSIKLTASVFIDKVTSDVEVTVFSYKDSDIVENKYIGDNKYSVIIHRV